MQAAKKPQDEIDLEEMNRKAQELEALKAANMQRIKDAMERSKVLEIKQDIIAQSAKQRKEQQERRQQAAAQRKLAAQHDLLKRPRSARLEGKERPQYNVQQPLYQLVAKQPRKRKAAASTTRGSGSSQGGPRVVPGHPAWHPSKPTAPEYAKEKALAAAEKMSRTSKRPTLVKVLDNSMVSSGFWLSLDKSSALLCALPLPDTAEGLLMTLQCDDPTRPADSFLRSVGARTGNSKDMRKWQVKLLDKGMGGNYGLSAGWRLYAIDQFLYPGDVVVFEKASNTALTAYNYRAWDYAKKADRPSDLEEVRFTRVLQELEGPAGAAQPGTDTAQDASS